MSININLFKKTPVVLLAETGHKLAYGQQFSSYVIANSSPRIRNPGK